MINKKNTVELMRNDVFNPVHTAGLFVSKHLIVMLCMHVYVRAKKEQI